MPPVTQQLVGTPRMMLPPMGLRDRRIDECPTMWFNRDFFECPWPDWQVDAVGPTRFVSHTNPGKPWSVIGCASR